MVSTNLGHWKMEETTVYKKLPPVLPIYDSYVHPTIFLYVCVSIMLLGKIKATNLRIFGFLISEHLK